MLRIAQTIALTLAFLVRVQAEPLDDTAQIASQQKIITQIYKLESAGEGLSYLETLAILAAYGKWTRYEGEAATGGIQPNENSNIVKFIDRIKPDLANVKKTVERSKSATEEDLKGVSDIFFNVEKLITVSMEVHDLLEAGKTDEANVVFHDKSIPLLSAINGNSYTLIFDLEKRISKTALTALRKK